MQVTKSKFSKKDKIEVLFQSLLENRSNDILDSDLEWIIYRRRQEVVDYLDQNFIERSYNLDQRQDIYALLLSLYVNNLDAIKPLILKLVASENDEEAKKCLSTMLTFRPEKNKK